MKRPVIIVDPRSAGVELAPAFAAHGVPAIAITLEQPQIRSGYGREIRAADFAQVIPAQHGLAGKLAKRDPLAILPGAEGGVPLAQELSEILTPWMANDPKKSPHRIHKSQMQQALKEAGVPAIRTLNTSSEKEVEEWLEENELCHVPLIIKPPISAGSNRVFHISAGRNWRTAFREVLAAPSVLTGTANESAVVQEQAQGGEFSVGTVSADGKHSLTHLIKYNKISFNGRQTVYDHVEFVPFSTEEHQALFEYTQKALDALGVRWGAAHNEVMMTPEGPRLIESVPRMTGGPVVHFSREATGSSQADRLAEAIVAGDTQAKVYSFLKTVVPVFLRSPKEGRLLNIEAMSEASRLQTHLSQHFWFKNGDRVPQTVDYLTSLGIVALAGDRAAIFEDYKRIRNMESKLVIQEG